MPPESPDVERKSAGRKDHLDRVSEFASARDGAGQMARIDGSGLHR